MHKQPYTQPVNVSENRCVKKADKKEHNSIYTESWKLPHHTQGGQSLLGGHGGGGREAAAKGERDSCAPHRGCGDGFPSPPKLRNPSHCMLFAC